MTTNTDKAHEAFKEWKANTKLPMISCEYAWRCAWQAATQANKEALREVLGSLNYMVDDMKMRMDIDHDNSEVKEKYGAKLSCAGEKSDDGTYTFPMGNGAFIGLDRAIEKLKQLTGDE